MTQAPSTYQRWTRRLAAALVLALVALLGGLGWWWQSTLRLDGIRVVGARHAPADTLRALAQVDPDARLYALDPALIADRVQRHPWVEAASVMRLPTGTLRISVTERTPAALAMNEDGFPAFYVDRHGFCMPLADSTGYDVPLLSGVGDAYRPMRPLPHPPLRQMLEALAASDVQALVGEIVVRPDRTIWLYTVPTQAHDAIAVRLGQGDFGEKLRRLQAFWHQAVAPRPDTRFTRIDLRFDTQIVTQETTPSSLASRDPQAPEG